MDEGEEEKIRQIEGYLENMVRHTMSLQMFHSMATTTPSHRRGSSFGTITGEWLIVGSNMVVCPCDPLSKCMNPVSASDGEADEHISGPTVPPVHQKSLALAEGLANVLPVPHQHFTTLAKYQPPPPELHMYR